MRWQYVWSVPGRCLMKEGDRVIAHVLGDDCDVQRARARLIEAAPVMLYLLKEILPALGGEMAERVRLTIGHAEDRHPELLTPAFFDEVPADTSRRGGPPGGAVVLRGDSVVINPPCACLELCDECRAKMQPPQTTEVTHD